MKVEISEFSDKIAFWNAALDVVMEAYSMRDDSFRLAMSGGSAASLLGVLNENKFAWNETHLYQVDERFVAASDPDSNKRLLEEKLRSCEVGNKQYFQIFKTREQSIEDYRERLKEDKDGYLFDLCVLGIGPDGHTASLFPQSPVLDTSDLVVATETDSFAVRERLSLSFAAIERSRKILVLMMGAGKADIIKTIQVPDQNFKNFPACRILEMPQAQILWCND